MSENSSPGSSHQFRRRAASAIEDDRLQGALEKATAKFRDARTSALDLLPGADELRDHFKAIRSSTLAELEKHLQTFEEQAEASGAHVYRADGASRACDIVVQIAQRHGVSLVTKTKSMATEEIHLNQALQESGISPVETDLGEFIIQLAGEPPYHILAPATHKTKDQVAELFTRVKGQAVGSDDISELTAEARALLRQKFLDAGMGITGGNIGIAETGTVVLVTNEGNGEMVTALPPVHVVVIGIEKIAPSWDGAAPWLALLARCATGQAMSVYTTFITGPAHQEDPDGPSELHIILLDGGRSDLLGTKYEEALQCIRCGACLNVCPVYREAGGHAYGSPYSGPIGAVISPLLYGLEKYEGLPQASSLCGACLDVCPARIDLPRMLLELRADEVDQKIMPWHERLAESAAAEIFAHERLLRSTTGALRLFQKPFVKDNQLNLPDRFHPAPGRQLPSLAQKPFRDLWKELETEDQALPSSTSQMSDPLTRRNEVSPKMDEVLKMDEVHQESMQTGDRRPATGDQPLAPWPSQRSYTDLPGQFETALTNAGGEVKRAYSIDDAFDTLDKILNQIGAEKAIVNDQNPTNTMNLSDRWPEINWFKAGIDSEIFRSFASKADIGISTAEVGLAETGTVIVQSGPGLSRLTALMPPVHVALVPTSCLTANIFSWTSSPRDDPPAALTLISGPSKTGDIEQTLTTGVHGPKRFIAILYDD